MNAPHNSLRRAATGLVAIIYVLLIFGASVRVWGAGLACPDWPLCFGMLVPEIDFKVGLEFGHRVYAGGVSLLFVWLGYRLWREREPLARCVAVVVGGSCRAIHTGHPRRVDSPRASRAMDGVQSLAGGEHLLCFDLVAGAPS